MKNPAMSIWLSWANRAAGMMSAAATAAMRRNQAAMTKSLLTPPKTRPRPKRKMPKR